MNKNTNWKVKNINGTTGLRCKCRSWIAHWYQHTETTSRRTTCAVVGCMNQAKVGAHVRSVDKRTDVKWWIAPFCKSHNMYHFTDEVFLKSEVELIAANKSYTCNW